MLAGTSSKTPHGGLSRSFFSDSGGGSSSLPLPPHPRTSPTSCVATLTATSLPRHLLTTPSASNAMRPLPSQTGQGGHGCPLSLWEHQAPRVPKSWLGPLRRHEGGSKLRPHNGLGITPWGTTIPPLEAQHQNVPPPLIQPSLN